MNKRAVAVIIRDGKILLMHRIKNGLEYIVFPGGGLEEGESPEEAVVREVKEEFNLDVKVDKFLFQIENQGRQEFYYLIRKFSGIPEISGEEKERMNENNQYRPVWEDLGKIETIVNLYPEQARLKIEEMAEEF